MKKQQMILIMGGQGVGKGTISRMLQTEYGFDYIETGAMLRAMSSNIDVMKTIYAGNLVPDGILFELIGGKISSGKDVLLDGFPRKISQARWLIDNYADRFDIYVLYLSVSEDVLIQRINKRIAEGSKRADDASPEIIRKRLDNYFKITMPAIDWLSKSPDVHFFEIDANGSIAENYSDIISALGLSR